MINEQRVKLMTKLALYEKNEGVRDSRINTYFKSDYLGFQLIGSFICCTLACLLGVAIYAAYSFEELMLTIYSMDLAAFVGKAILYYAAILILFLGVTYFVYAYRYNRMRRNLDAYYKSLKNLGESYRKERDY